MNVMRRLKSIASGRTSISSDPVSFFFFLGLVFVWLLRKFSKRRKYNVEALKLYCYFYLFI